VASARRVWALQVAVGGAGALTTAAALFVAASRIDFSLPSLQQIAAACQRYALPHVRPISVLVLLIGSVAVAAVFLGARGLVRQLRAGRRLERELRLLGPLPGSAAAQVIDDDRPRAFCIGLLSPRIYVSRGALEILGDEERAAVLAHEAHHARRRDPLRLLLTRTVADGLFFLPVVRRLSERCAALAELAADEAAVRARGGRHALASALLAFDAQPTAAGVGIAPERVDHLLGERARWELPTLLLVGGVATIGVVLAATLRVAEVAGHGTLPLPVLLAQSCMLVMAAAPLIVGAMAILGARRLVLASTTA
jgi:beta-lactamase regulating signal transducer with metallopeptidase domain